jgi:uncharacterized protein (UPF0548 family)
MRVGELSWPAPDATEMQRLWLASCDADFSYADPGALLRRSVAPLYERTRTIGRGDECFAAAVAFVQTWGPQRALGTRIHPCDSRVAEGATMVQCLRVAGCFVTAPVRVIGVTRSDDRFAYAYGTLPGHPERGEEVFTVERGTDGEVRVTVAVRAESGTLLTRCGAPVARRLQRRALGIYVDAIARTSEPGEQR